MSRRGWKPNPDAPRRSVYELVTDRLVTALETGTVPWRKPWGARNGEGLVMPCNLITRRPYRGVNVFLTACQGYASPYWLTFAQAKANGASVRKGETGTPVIFWNWVLRKGKDADGEDAAERIPFVRYYTVFNSDQVDGLGEWLPPADLEAPAFEPIDEAERLLARYLGNGGPTFAETRDGRAYYVPSRDHVNMPGRLAFDTPAAFYATAFHELGHSTGHASRLARPGIVDAAAFRSHAYSREELVAEMTAAFLCGVTGIDSPELDKNHAAYLASWIRALKGDPKMVIVAGAQAQRAADLIRGVVAGDKADDDTTAGVEVAA